MDRQPQPFPFFSNNQPLVPISLSFILGIIAASYHWLNDKTCFSILIITMLILTLGIIKKWRFNFLLICIVFFLLGAILSSQQINPSFPPNHIKIIAEQYSSGKKDDPGISIEGVLSDAPERFPDKTRLSIDTERIFINPPSPPFNKGGMGGFIPSPIKDFGGKVTGKILITVGSPSVNPHTKDFGVGVKVNYGDRIRFVAKLRIPRNFGNPGEFDYAGNLAREGIYATGYVENERWIAVLGNEPQHGLRLMVERLRDKIRDFIDGSGMENSAIIKALIIGEEGGISQETRNSFNITATTHILSISGLHIGIVALAAYWVTFQLLRLSAKLTLAVNIRKLAAVSGIIPVLLYGAMAGFSVPTLRSVIMVLIFIIAVLADRERSLYNTLAVAALIILIMSPQAPYDISFQLSFISVLAILYLVPKIQTLWKQRENMHKLLPPHPARKLFANYFLSPLAVSIAASLGTAPFVAWHFHRVSLIGIFANLIAVPLMGFAAVILGFISCLGSFFNQSAALIILKLADISINVSLWIVDLFAEIPYASVFTTTPTITEAILFYLLIICVVEFNKARLFQYGIAVVMLCFIVDYSFWHYGLNHNPNLKVTFISVGQGDSALVEFPYGKRMLIDGGGFYKEDFDVGERIIAPFLWKNKIKKIDYLILSHPQTDHMKGLNFIAKRFDVKEFRWNGEAGNDWTYTELMQALDTHHIKKFITNSSTPPLNINGVHISFLNPSQGSHLDVNNNSLVVKLKYKDVSLLFTGDIGAAGESALLNQDKDIGATILKVPHHGSRTSSTIDFLNKVKPELAVASVGYINPFGFPHPEIAQRYKDLNISLLRTDIMGAITIETDGKEKRIISYR